MLITRGGNIFFTQLRLLIFFCKNKMKKVIKWLKESNRYKHLIGGVLIGAGANSLYCAAYAGIGVATALEVKDRMWGGKADIIDWGLTVGGVAIGFGVRTLVNLVIL